jgi:hypothetical protein
LSIKNYAALRLPYILKEKTKTEKNKKESRIKRRACQACQGF